MRSHPSSHLCFDDWHEFSYVNFFIGCSRSLFTSFLDFYYFVAMFSSNSKGIGKLGKMVEGVAIWRIFCKEKSKDVSDVFLILSDLRRDRLIFLLIFIAFSHRENLYILAFSKKIERNISLQWQITFINGSPWERNNCHF